MVDVPLRLAGPSDAPELVRLAEQLYADIGTRTHPAWKRTALDDLAARLGGELIAVVAGTPGSPLLAMGLAVVVRGVRSPRRPTPLSAYVEWLVTDRSHRGAGLGTAVLDRLLLELRARDVSVVDLHASSAGAALYERAGFDSDGPRAMSLRLRPVPPEALASPEPQQRGGPGVTGPSTRVPPTVS